MLYVGIYVYVLYTYIAPLTINHNRTKSPKIIKKISRTIKLNELRYLNIMYVKALRENY